MGTLICRILDVLLIIFFIGVVCVIIYLVFRPILLLFGFISLIIAGKESFLWQNFGISDTMELLRIFGMFFMALLAAGLIGGALGGSEGTGWPSAGD